jgi:hypothetical protein
MSKKLLLVDPRTFLYTDVFTTDRSSGAVDAHKVVELNDQGFIDQTLLGSSGTTIASVYESAGVADAHKIIETADSGYIDPSLVATSVGSGFTATAASAIAAGSFVHVYSYQGLKLAEPALALDSTKLAHGFVAKAAGVGEIVLVLTRAIVNVPTGALTTLDLMSPIYLDPNLPGMFTTVAPGSPHAVQLLGMVDSVGGSLSSLYVNIQALNAGGSNSGSGIADFTARNTNGVLEILDPSGSVLAPLHVQSVQIGAFSAARMISVPIGDGHASTFIIPHNLNNPVPMWSILDFTTSPPEPVWPKMEFPDANHIRVSFGSVPGINQYGLTLIG